MKTLIIAAAGAALAVLPATAAADPVSPINSATVWNSGQSGTGCIVFDGQSEAYDPDCTWTVVFRLDRDGENAGFIVQQAGTLQSYQTAPDQAFVYRDEYDAGQCAYMTVIKPSGQVNTHIDCNAN